MAAGGLFFGIELLVWLSIGLAGWVAISLRMRPRASLLALLAALVAAPLAGALPGALGWNTLPGLIFGLALALVGAMAAAWQTMKRLPDPEAGGREAVLRP